MNNNSSIGHTWKKLRNELFTPEEIADSDFRVALIGKISKICTEKNISPTQYEHIIEMLSDYMLYKEAKKRIDNNISSENISHEALMKELNITQEDLDDIAVEFE